MKSTNERTNERRSGGFHVGIYDFGKVMDAVDRQGLPDAHTALKRLAALCRLAEAAGYERFWVAEHHTEDTAEASPELAVAYLAAHTRTIRVGTGVTIAPYYHSLKIAENARLLEALFPGRVDIGLGRGPAGSRATSEALTDGDPSSLESAAFETKVGEVINFLDGAYAYGHKYADVRAVPVGVPTPDIWVVGGSPPSMRLAAQHGVGYAISHFLRALQPGHDPVADAAEIDRSYSACFKGRSSQPRFAVAVTALCAPTTAAAKRLDMKARSVGMIANNIVGDPATCRAKFEELRKVYATSHFVVGTTCLSWTQRKQSFELLAGALELGRARTAPLVR